MTDKFRALLGFAVKAGKVSFGHDAAKQSVRGGKAKLLVLTADASARLCEEMRGLCGEAVPVLATDLTIAQVGALLGRKAAVLTVNDPSFCESLRNQAEQAE